MLILLHTYRDTIWQKKGIVYQYSTEDFRCVCLPKDLFRPTKDPSVILYKSLPNFVWNLQVAYLPYLYFRFDTFNVNREKDICKKVFFFFYS